MWRAITIEPVGQVSYLVEFHWLHAWFKLRLIFVAKKKRGLNCASPLAIQSSHRLAATAAVTATKTDEISQSDPPPHTLTPSPGQCDPPV